MGFNSITQQAKPVKCNKFDGIQRKMFIFSLFNDILITCVLSHNLIQCCTLYVISLVPSIVFFYF